MELIFPFLMFVMLFVLIFLGIPVAFCLLATGAVFGLVAFGSGLGLQLLGAVYSVASNFVLVAIPLFILMGALLERSRIAADLLNALRLLLGRTPGGLSIATILICAIFAASSGVVGAVEILVGLMAIPPMLAAGYKRDLVCGTICAGGSLGTIIPPSIIVIIYASMADLSVGDLFAGILLPGLLMAGMFIAYVLIRCMIRPEDGPAMSREQLESVSLGRKLWLLVSALLPCTLLILAVIGSIFVGIASPTEAAALGVIGALLLSVFYRQFSVTMLMDSLKQTISITSMVMFIILGGTLFAGSFLVNGGGIAVREVLGGLEFGPQATIILFLFVIFILGFVLDWISILLVTIPIFNPIILQLGLDPIWFAVMVCVVLQTSYLTPPMAPSIFYLQSIAPPDIKLKHMYRGVLPFIGVQFLVLGLVYLWPSIATYMPQVLFRL